jgi:hypothetical protein
MVLTAYNGRRFKGKDLTTMSILTSYRPNFCCECGNKIVRLRWFVWTSRRFCDQCFRAFGKSHWLRPSITLLVFFLAAMLLGRGCRRASPPLIIERPVNSTANSGAIPGAPNPTANGPQPTPMLEQLYTCGARTKKGTPCSRRVHGPTRCWQHKGAAAMLPQEKLRIKE